MLKRVKKILIPFAKDDLLWLMDEDGKYYAMYIETIGQVVRAIEVPAPCKEED